MPRSLILTTALFALLAGCASVPDLGPKPVPAAAESFESAASFADANGEWPAEGWWHSFGDAQLGALIAEGLERSEEHTSELQSLMRISYAVFCLKKKT